MVRRKLQKANTVLLFCFLILIGLYYGSSVLIPITFGVFFSTLVVPISNLLERKAGMGRLSSSFISTLILFIGVGLIFFFLFQQLGVFVNDLMDRKEELRGYLLEVQKKLVTSTGFSIEEQEEMVRDRLAEIMNFAQRFLSGILTDVTGVILQFMLVLIYVFLLLINRDKFVEFIMRYVPREKRVKTGRILVETKKVAHKYLWGRLQVMLLLGIMYAITFYSYGLPHAMLLILFGVIITIVPYIGPLLSGVLPVLFMVIFGGSYLEIISFALIVLTIQLIESYVLEPIIIGSEVEQSPLFVIIAIILGGALWGAAGLVLFVPIFGILKIIFDHNRELEPIGFLIGYERPGAGEGLLEKIKKKIRK